MKIYSVDNKKYIVLSKEGRSNICNLFGKDYISRLSSVLPVELKMAWEVHEDLPELTKDMYTYLLLDEKQMLLFCIKHGITFSAATINKHE